MTPETHRDPKWDVLRGLAILGILPVNIWVFGCPLGALDQPNLALRAAPLDALSWALVTLFLEHKMVLILACMMGFGIAVMNQHPDGPARLLRRLIVLASLGLLHSYFIWWGDILWLLAVSGCFAWACRSLTLRRLVGLAVVCLSTPSLLLILWSLASPVSFSTAFEPFTQPQFEQALAAYQGHYWAQFAQRWPMTLWLQTLGLLSYGLWSVLGAMLLGMALYRVRDHQKTLTSGFHGLCFLLSGLALSAIVIITQWHASGFALGIAAALLPLAAGLQSTGYVLLFMRAWHQADASNRLLLNQYLGSVGRLSLSLYLLQSLILSGLFYGHGLGLMGQLSLSQLLLLALGLCLGLIVLATVWNKYLGAGPAERLWRALSYG